MTSLADRIIQAACARHGASLEKIRGWGRLKPETAARGQMAALLHEWRGLSWPEIGLMMNKRHTTCMAAAARFWLAWEAEHGE